MNDGDAGWVERGEKAHRIYRKYISHVKRGIRTTYTNSFPVCCDENKITGKHDEHKDILATRFTDRSTIIPSKGFPLPRTSSEE